MAAPQTSSAITRFQQNARMQPSGDASATLLARPKQCRSLKMVQLRPFRTELLLADRHQRFVDAQVSAGRHVSGSEVVRKDALRRCEDDLRREQAHLEYLNKPAEQGEAAYARSDVVRVERDGLSAFVRGSAERAGRRSTRDAT